MGIGSGNSLKPVCLHAHCHSYALLMRLEILAHPAFIYKRREFDANLKITVCLVKPYVFDT